MRSARGGSNPSRRTTGRGSQFDPLPISDIGGRCHAASSPSALHRARLPRNYPRGGRCEEHARQDATRRDTQGAYKTTAWQRARRSFLYANPWCVLCGRTAQVADHHPLSRRDLVARGEAKPDAPKHLRPLCTLCHNRETARLQPGGFAAERRSEAQTGLSAYGRFEGASEAHSGLPDARGPAR